MTKTLIGVFIATFSWVGWGKAPTVFTPTIPESNGNLFKFQKALVQNLNPVFDGVAEPISVDTVKEKLVDPAFVIFDRYVNKQSLKEMLARPDAPKPGCQLFEYCSVCDLGQASFAQVYDHISKQNQADPKTAKVFEAFNQFVAQTSSAVDLTANKAYVPPKSMHELITRLGSSAFVDSPTLELDISYFQLSVLNLVDLLDHSKAGSIPTKKIQEKVLGAFDNAKDNVLQELMLCRSFKKTATTAQPDSTTSGDQAGPTEPSSDEKVLDQGPFLMEKRKMLFRFTAPEEPQETPKK